MKIVVERKDGVDEKKLFDALVDLARHEWPYGSIQTDPEELAVEGTARRDFIFGSYEVVFYVSLIQGGDIPVKFQHNLFVDRKKGKVEIVVWLYGPKAGYGLWRPLELYNYSALDRDLKQFEREVTDFLKENSLEFSIEKE